MVLVEVVKVVAVVETVVAAVLVCCAIVDCATDDDCEDCCAICVWVEGGVNIIVTGEAVVVVIVVAVEVAVEVTAEVNWKLLADELTALFEPW